MATDALRRRLATGARGEIANATEIAREVIDHPGLLLPLIDCLEDDDPTMVAHAAHAAMQVSLDRIDLFDQMAGRLIAILREGAAWELGEQLPKILARLRLTGRQAEELTDILAAKLDDRSNIAAASALSALVDLAGQGLMPAERVRALHQAALESPRKALSARARRLTKLVQQLA